MRHKQELPHFKKDSMKTGIELIADERQEQIVKHGRSVELDILNNSNEQLSEAAGWLCYNEQGCADLDDVIEDHCPDGWDQELWTKMCRKPFKERLIIAGALIAAEIDRLQNIG